MTTPLGNRFDYLRPATPAEAASCKADLGAGAVFWAGGTDIGLAWRRGLVKPTHCIDLTGITGFDSVTKQGDEVRIGALTTLHRLERSGDVHRYLATLAAVAKLMNTPQTRTLATVGGNLCNASPAADLLPPLVAMGAEVHLQAAAGIRTLPVSDFVVGPGRTALEPGEMVTEIGLPLPDRPCAAAYHRIDRTVVDIALVSASTVLVVDHDEVVSDARIALGAVAPSILRVPDAEALLTGARLADLDSTTLGSAGRLAAEQARPISDVRTSAEYRRKMVAVMVRRALEDTIEQLRGSLR